MTARTRTILVATLAALLAYGAPAQAALHAIAAGIQYVMDKNLAAYNSKDVAATMATIDSRSPDYDTTKAAIEQQFKDNLDVNATLVSFDYIGHDDEFAVARAKVKSTSKPGSGFADNTIDAIFLFHQENGTWKLWSEQILAVQTP